MDKLDNYSHKLSMKQEIAYEQARHLMKKSLYKLKKNNAKGNIFQSAYNDSVNKIKQLGGSKIIIKVNYDNIY